MSDRYLRQLLRGAQQGLVPLQDYVAAALREMSFEDVLASLAGFSVEDIRLAFKLVWIPAYAAQSKENKTRIALAGVLGDEVSSRVAPSREEDDFPDYAFFERNQAILSDNDWRLFAADCAEHVLHYYEEAHPGDDRPRNAIVVARRYAIGEVTKQELDAARPAAWSAARDAAESAAWLAAGAAARSAAVSAADDAWSAAWHATESAASFAADAGSAARQAEIAWQRERLIDYLVGLSALPRLP